MCKRTHTNTKTLLSSTLVHSKQPAHLNSYGPHIDFQSLWRSAAVILREIASACAITLFFFSAYITGMTADWQLVKTSLPLLPLHIFIFTTNAMIYVFKG